LGINTLCFFFIKSEDLELNADIIKEEGDDMKSVINESQNSISDGE